MADLEVNFDIKGLNRVRNQLRLIASMHPELTDPIIEKHAKNESKRLRGKSYPPELPNQVYQRTYRLRRSFRAQHVKPGHWRIINRVRSPMGRQYAVWVIKKGMQSRKFWGRPAPPGMSHADRWWTIEDTLQDEMPKLTQALSRELEKQLEREAG